MEKRIGTGLINEPAPDRPGAGGQKRALPTVIEPDAASLRGYTRLTSLRRNLGRTHGALIKLGR